MEKTSKELLREFVNSQNFTSMTDIFNAMKELFSDVLQQVMEAKLEEKLGYEKSESVSRDGKNISSKNYRNGHSKKNIKTQLGEVNVKENTAATQTAWRKRSSPSTLSVCLSGALGQPCLSFHYNRTQPESLRTY